MSHLKFGAEGRLFGGSPALWSSPSSRLPVQTCGCPGATHGPGDAPTSLGHCHGSGAATSLPSPARSRVPAAPLPAGSTQAGTCHGLQAAGTQKLHLLQPRALREPPWCLGPVRMALFEKINKIIAEASEVKGTKSSRFPAKLCFIALHKHS